MQKHLFACPLTRGPGGANTTRWVRLGMASLQGLTIAGSNLLQGLTIDVIFEQILDAGVVVCHLVEEQLALLLLLLTNNTTGPPASAARLRRCPTLAQLTSALRPGKNETSARAQQRHNSGSVPGPAATPGMCPAGHKWRKLRRNGRNDCTPAVVPGGNDDGR